MTAYYIKSGATSGLAPQGLRFNTELFGNPKLISCMESTSSSLHCSHRMADAAQIVVVSVATARTDHDVGLTAWNGLAKDNLADRLF